MQVSYGTATSRIPRRMPLPDSALTEEFRPRPRSVPDTRQYSMHHRPFQSQTWGFARGSAGGGGMNFEALALSGTPHLRQLS